MYWSLSYSLLIYCKYIITNYRCIHIELLIAIICRLVDYEKMWFCDYFSIGDFSLYQHFKKRWLLFSILSSRLWFILNHLQFLSHYISSSIRVVTFFAIFGIEFLEGCMEKTIFLEEISLLSSPKETSIVTPWERIQINNNDLSNRLFYI